MLIVGVSRRIELCGWEGEEEYFFFYGSRTDLVSEGFGGVNGDLWMID